MNRPTVTEVQHNGCSAHATPRDQRLANLEARVHALELERSRLEIDNQNLRHEVRHLRNRPGGLSYEQRTGHPF